MLKCQSLRTWLEHLKKNGELASIDEKVSLQFEVAGMTKMLDGKKAAYFTDVEGYDIPVVAGIATTRKQFADALDITEREMNEKFLHALDHPLTCQQVESHEAPVHEVVVKDDDIDLLKMLPIPVHHEKDSGHYISAGLAIAKDPKTGSQNVSIHRLQVSGRNRLGALLLPRHLYNFYKNAEEQGKPLEVAIVIGVDPITLLASQAIAPLGQDEMEIAGALKGESVPVVKCKTIDVFVPAHAEIVLEGKILPHVREAEGPFGEFPKYYGPRSDKEVIEISTITHRKNPIYQTIVPASYEHLLLGGIPREASILRALRNTVPTVKNVHLTLGGTCRYHLIVSMQKRNEGEAKNVILAAFAAHYDIKHVTVVDDEVDIFNLEEVEWALATRFQADKDLVIVNGALGSKLDPSTSNGVSSKMGFDCTVPLNSEPMAYERIKIPGIEKLNVDKYLK
ncbi:2,5-furandicarboxylate decarboxylase 1 [Caldalkalibacillus uzonensis]|uniref:2,5-furandicarboxylate decarboxylase 1 n=1 Tax=Caldalkalibacillus uzonensis TaxID=353224 RepID=A0ABU0CXY9_9BACI|nr:UbiD family decarboxylase [Caldalkalibacillus uzonensis]MDQ0341016.1 2,5-furandicarboxylate decarboxylase 1 [Caldalkalibacillus uzonensis]